MDYLEIRELYHHGIKGQRWGIRRFQNEDGSLTAEGRQRYGVNDSGQMSKEGKKLYKQDKKEQKIANRSNLANTSIGAIKGSALAYAGIAGASLALAGVGALYLKKNGDNMSLDKLISLAKASETIGMIAKKATPAVIGAGAAIGGAKAYANQKKIKEEQRR